MKYTKTVTTKNLAMPALLSAGLQRLVLQPQGTVDRYRIFARPPAATGVAGDWQKVGDHLQQAMVQAAPQP
jgi:hypothetical protein